MQRIRKGKHRCLWKYNWFYWTEVFTPSLESILSNANGSTHSDILYLFLINPITHSTWIRTEDICQDTTSCFVLNRVFLFAKLGIITSTPHPVANSSWSMKPQSDKIWSPWWCKLGFIKSKSLTIPISLTRPSHAFDIKWNRANRCACN